MESFPDLRSSPRPAVLCNGSLIFSALSPVYKYRFISVFISVLPPLLDCELHKSAELMMSGWSLTAPWVPGVGYIAGEFLSEQMNEGFWR